MENISKKTFEETSYLSHESWFAKQYPDQEKRLNTIRKWQKSIENNTIDYWLHERLFELANPLINAGESWLTVGDGYGFDANYFKRKGCTVMATDIGGAFLPLVKDLHLIDNFSVENVEKLTFEDNSFDYVFCKEAYHHFPRAYLGVYEMIRVAKKAIILTEPQDPLTKMPLMLAVKNILDRFDPTILQKYWKNRYSFEEVGNYVFKLSDREMEKIAMGMNLPAIAFKGINNSYWKAGLDTEIANNNSNAFRKIQSKLRRDNFLCKLGILPYQVLSAVIFKTLPTQETINNLKNEGYLYYEFPKNPYL
ncbi:MULTISPECIES: class I SAM-dependent methyltransferase [unclassified Arcicella]|uniref:class I SAM-dependent methyltransferase n=1 Tax=unclassified Arcicella TaxID=2644986 RepID=UPI002858819F|nr:MULTISPECIES: class I SAM-dependent methyltransferase [unclassified Arcicella]MDR6564919.1 ubiquinone/menaquinone biosynthesis C-methylase UbiE [Arcicella sp. BE51]MDR6814709.1 ubiquinone/menaquinone biosynthesis C-methylase UbiE [Arcicella sp. BE140]MDR6826128.1 ubiquinone/menaquinone biosynthesis C-methylase UbiE [Arcicella sp. BE139]